MRHTFIVSLTQLSFHFLGEPAAPARPLLPPPPQLSLDSRAHAVRTRLVKLASRPVALTVTDNRRSVIAAQQHGRVLALRLHHMFLDADADTLADLVAWILHHDGAAGVRLDAYVTAHRHLIRSRPVTRDITLDSEGRHHDLRDILRGVADHYLGRQPDVRITWGKRAPRRRRRSIQLGSYVREDTLIRVHRALDAEWVPRFFVESVVYHELLHHELPVHRVDGRRRVHTGEFRRREAIFERHAEALAFERDNLGQLLRS